MYVEHIDRTGTDFYRIACEQRSEVGRGSGDPAGELSCAWKKTVRGRGGELPRPITSEYFRFHPPPNQIPQRHQLAASVQAIKRDCQPFEITILTGATGTH